MEEKGESIFVYFVFVESTELSIFKSNTCQVRYYLTFMHSYLMLNLSEDFLYTLIYVIHILVSDNRVSNIIEVNSFAIYSKSFLDHRLKEDYWIWFCN